MKSGVKLVLKIMLAGSLPILLEVQKIIGVKKMVHPNLARLFAVESYNSALHCEF